MKTTVSEVITKAPWEQVLDCAWIKRVFFEVDDAAGREVGAKVTIESHGLKGYDITIQATRNGKLYGATRKPGAARYGSLDQAKAAADKKLQVSKIRAARKATLVRKAAVR
jgi:hypothetical protein